MILLLKTIENAPVSQWENFQGFFQKWQDKSVPKEFSQYLREFLISLGIPAEDPSENIAQLLDANSGAKEELLDALHLLAFSSNQHVRLWSRISAYVLTPDAFAQKPNELPPFSDENEWNGLYEEYFSVWPAAFAAGLLTYQFTIVDENQQSQTYKFNDARDIVKYRDILVSNNAATTPYLADEDGPLAILERLKLDKRNAPLPKNTDNISIVCPDIYDNIESGFSSSLSMIIHLMLLKVGLKQGDSNSIGGTEERASIPAQRAGLKFFKLVEDTTDSQRRTLEETGVQNIYINLKKPHTDLAACVAVNQNIIDRILSDEKRLKKLFSLKVAKKPKTPIDQTKEKTQVGNGLTDQIKDIQRYCTYDNNKTLRDGDIETIRNLLLSVQNEESPTKTLYNQLGEHGITDSFLLSSIGAEIERMGFRLWIKSISDFHLLSSLFKNNEAILTKIKKWTLSNLKYTITSKNELIGFVISAKDPKFIQEYLRKNPIDESLTISTHPDIEPPFNDYSPEFQLLLWDSLNLDKVFLSNAIEKNKESLHDIIIQLTNKSEIKYFSLDYIIKIPEILLKTEQDERLKVIKKEIMKSIRQYLLDIDDRIIEAVSFKMTKEKQNLLNKARDDNRPLSEQEAIEQVENDIFSLSENDERKKTMNFSLSLKRFTRKIVIDYTKIDLTPTKKQENKLSDFYYKNFERAYVGHLKTISDEDMKLKEKLEENPPEYPLSDRARMDLFLHATITEQDDYLSDVTIESFNKTVFIERFIHHFFNAPLPNRKLALLNKQLEKLLTSPNHPLRIPRGRFLTAQNGMTKSLKLLIMAVLENISEKIALPALIGSNEPCINQRRRLVDLLEILSVFLESIKQSNPTDYSDIQKSITNFKQTPKITSILRSHFKSEEDNGNELSARNIIDSMDPFIFYPTDSDSYNTRADLRRTAYSVILSHLSKVLAFSSNQTFLEDFLAHDAPFNKESQFIIKKIASIPQGEFERVIRYLDDLRNSDLFRAHLGYVSRVVSLSPTTTSKKLGSLITGLRRVHDQYHTSRPLPPAQPQTLINAP